MMRKTDKEARPYRGVRDEIREQQLKTKDMSAKGKLQYFWCYYKYHTLAAAFIIFFVVSILHNILSAKDYAFYGIMLNSINLDGDQMQASFGEYASLDLEEYECFIDTQSTLSYSSMTQYDMATAQKIIALCQTGDLDAVVFDSQVFNTYANNELFADLRTIYSDAELQKYQDQLYYVDYAEILRAKEDIDYENADLVSTEENGALTLDEILAEAETHRQPENMEQPMPVGIFLDASPFEEQTGAYGQLQPVFGIAVTSTRTDTAKQYLEFLWDDAVDFGSMVAAYE